MLEKKAYIFGTIFFLDTRIQNVGAIKYKETDELIWWKIENKKVNKF